MHQHTFRKKSHKRGDHWSESDLKSQGKTPNLRTQHVGLRCGVLEQFIKFKGADWVGMIFGLISTYFLAKGKRAGFLFGVVGGCGWVTFGILTGSIASILANVSFITINCLGYFRWKRKQEEDGKAEKRESGNLKKAPREES